LIWLAALLVTADESPPDCRRVRSDPELQACEVERSPNDVLTSAGLPPAGILGADAIRFSTQPSLGGRAIVVELVRSAAGRGHTRIVWGDGHPYQGWKIAGSARCELPAGEYRGVAGIIDAALASYRPRPTAESEMIVCMDGPEYLT
jgi:hypothetical protein